LTRVSGAQRLHGAFPGETLERLRRLKAQYDPDSVFDQNFAIPRSSGQGWNGQVAQRGAR
jgi:hypothetical protein